jgi:hypothetical protein
MLAFAALAVAALLGVAQSRGVNATTSPGRCLDEQMELTWNPDVAAASGNNPQLWRLVNRSSRSCFLHGYPDLRFFDRAGHLMPFKIVDGGDMMVTSRRPQSVLVKPHGAAWVLFNTFRCDLGERTQAARAELRLAKTPEARPILIRYYPSLCAHVTVTAVTVSPFEAGRRAVFAH